VRASDAGARAPAHTFVGPMLRRLALDLRDEHALQLVEVERLLKGCALILVGWSARKCTGSGFEEMRTNM